MVNMSVLINAMEFCGGERLICPIYLYIGMGMLFKSMSEIREYL